MAINVDCKVRPETCALEVQHTAKRLLFSKLEFPEAKDILFSDESWFFKADNRRHMWVKPGQKVVLRPVEKRVDKKLKLMIFGIIGGGLYFFFQAWRRNEKMQHFMDKLLLRIPIFGALVEKSVVARWTRTLSTMFAAGVPLVEALDSVGGASGNAVYAVATEKIQQEVSTGTSLTAAMTNANIFPSMVIQMCAIGEESGSIDHMLGKAADFYEAEVDDMVAGLSSLMEPIIIVILGTIIGGIVVSMYLPIFKLGQVV